MPLLEVENLTKHFGGLVAVKGVSFSVERGMICGLIGPNGAGKTTIFHMISGSLPPTKGKITFKNKQVTGFKSHQFCHLGICRTYQVPRPFHNMTVLENVKVGVCFGQGRQLLRDAGPKAEEILEFTQLSGKSSLLAKHLTVADRKRLEISRALASEPDLLLLDEVIAGLNPTETAALMDCIRKIREKGITVILIEHVMHAVMNLSDRIVVLNYGEKIAEGTPEEVAVNPRVIEAYLGRKETKCA